MRQTDKIALSVCLSGKLFKKMKNIGLKWALLIFVFLNCRVAQAAGLSTAFSEVTLENLEIGRSYSTKESANLPLEIVNTGKQEIDLKIEVLPPQPAELKEGFEPIPDTSWIKLDKADFKKIKPNGTAVTNVFVLVPNEKQYRGKKYQVFIWSHTVGQSIGIGLKSKLLFAIKSE